MSITSMLIHLISVWESKYLNVLEERGAEGEGGGGVAVTAAGDGTIRDGISGRAGLLPQAGGCADHGSPEGGGRPPPVAGFCFFWGGHPEGGGGGGGGGGGRGRHHSCCFAPHITKRS